MADSYHSTPHTTGSKGEHPQALAASLLENGVPLYRIQPGIKTPYKAPNGPVLPWGNVDVIDDPDKLQGWLKHGDNIAVATGWPKNSPIIAVGLDTYKDPKIIGWGKELGVSSAADVWVQRTGRGGWTVFYYYRETLTKHSNIENGALDLLSDGYCLVDPSNTRGIPGGGPYRWATDKSPLDIPLGELDEPPQALLDYWIGIDSGRAPEPTGLDSRPSQGFKPLPGQQYTVTELIRKHKPEYVIHEHTGNPRARWTCRCPLPTTGTPSMRDGFTIAADDDLWKCWTCDKSGNAITLLREMGGETGGRSGGTGLHGIPKGYGRWE